MDETSELRAAGGKGWSRVMAEHEVGVAAQHQPSHGLCAADLFGCCWQPDWSRQGDGRGCFIVAHTRVGGCVDATASPSLARWLSTWHLGCCLACAVQWLALHDNFGLPVHVFRCGGIYGEKAASWATIGGAHAARNATCQLCAWCIHVCDVQHHACS